MRTHDLIMLLIGIGIGTLATLCAVGARRLEKSGRR